MCKAKPLLIIIAVSVFLSILTLHHLRFIYLLPIPEYQIKIQANPATICEKIRSNEFKRLCFLKLKDKDFPVDLYSLKPFKPIFASEVPGNLYYTCGDIENIFRNTKEDPCYCSRNSLGGIYKRECLAYLENPYHCEAVMKEFEERAHCYQDAALIWQDPTLCERAYNAYVDSSNEDREAYRDFCYLAIVVRMMEEPRK